MPYIPRFAAYASAFEKAYESDDWTGLEGFFSEDAVYEIGLPILGQQRCEGRRAILDWFQTVLNDFDRRFDSRELTVLDGPTEHDAEVWIRGRATYRAGGVPTFELELEETARFDGDRIVRLEDRYTPEMRAETEAYLHEHGEKLGITVARR